MKLHAQLTPHKTLNGQLLRPNKTLNGQLSKPTEILKIERDYQNLYNKPRIEDVELIGNKQLEEFGIAECSSMDIINIFEEE